jgi:hypothetical protein
MLIKNKWCGYLDIEDVIPQQLCVSKLQQKIKPRILSSSSSSFILHDPQQYIQTIQSKGLQSNQ